MRTVKNIKQKAAALADPAPLAELPAKPWMEHAADGAHVITTGGLEAITMLAERGTTQEGIASHLGLSRRQFDSQIGKADSDPPSAARLAWESGFARHKSSLIE